MSMMIAKNLEEGDFFVVLDGENRFGENANHYYQCLGRGGPSESSTLFVSVKNYNLEGSPTAPRSLELDEHDLLYHLGNPMRQANELHDMLQNAAKRREEVI